MNCNYLLFGIYIYIYIYIYIVLYIYIYCIYYIYIYIYVLYYIYIYMSDVPVKCWKFQRMFLRICYEIVWKFQNKNSTTDRYDLIYVLLFYVRNNLLIFLLIFTNHNLLKIFIKALFLLSHKIYFLMSISVSCEVFFFNVYSSFGQDDVNQLRCSLILI